MSPRPRNRKNEELKPYPGLGQYKDGRFFFHNPHTGKQVSLRTKVLAEAITMWGIAKAACDAEYGNTDTTELAERIKQSNVPISRGANIHLSDFIREWREQHLEPGLVKVKIKRSQGQPLSDRTKADYTAQALQLEASPDARFPINSPRALPLLRTLLAPWGNTPTHYNHLKAVLGRVFDHAVFKGLVDRNPMRDIDKLAVEERKVLIPDEAYVAITNLLMVHQHNKHEFDGEWRAKIVDLAYMLSQQPVDIFSIKVAQLQLDAGEHGEIRLARSKTGVSGVIEMNAEMREVVDWLLAFRKAELAKVTVVKKEHAEFLLLYPAYFEARYRLRPVRHRTFSEYWREATAAAGYPGMYRLMDIRKKALTDEYGNQGENDKGLHDTERMKWHYRLIVPPKRSRNTLVSIRNKQTGGV